MSNDPTFRIIRDMKRLLTFAAIVMLVLPQAGLNAAAPQILPPSNERGGFTLQWKGDTDGAFTIQTTESLLNGVWLAGSSPMPWPIRTNLWNDATGSIGSRYYRVLSVQPSQRGKIISSRLLVGYSALELGFIFQLGGIPVQSQLGVEVYKLVYETIDPWGGVSRHLEWSSFRRGQTRASPSPAIKTGPWLQGRTPLPQRIW